MKLKEVEKDKPPKIVECTEAELFMYWLHNWSNFIDYYTYKHQCVELGTKILKEFE